MELTLRTRETLLLSTVMLLLALACGLPPLAQSAHYHEFADQRQWGGLPYAMDVLSNLPFALGGFWGWLIVARSTSLHGTQRRMAQLFFGGLVITAACSTWYHLSPHNASLAVDRLGMTVAFAGVMGLAVSARVSERAGLMSGLASLVLGAMSVGVWFERANLAPWAVYQFAGMALLLALLWLPKRPAQLNIAWLAVLGIYAVAKLLELADHPIFEMTGWVSGHSLKHIVASLAAWPVIKAIQQHQRSGLQVDDKP